jgi:hypothetical protein
VDKTGAPVAGVAVVVNPCQSWYVLSVILKYPKQPGCPEVILPLTREGASWVRVHHWMLLVIKQGSNNFSYWKAWILHC